MPETRKTPYLSTETPIEIPNDLPIPTTTRTLQPRSRATSMVRSEARSASGSRTGSRQGSRAGSPSSRASSSSRSRMARPPTIGDDAGIGLGGSNEVEIGIDSMNHVEAVNDVAEHKPIAGPSTAPFQRDADREIIVDSTMIDVDASSVNHQTEGDPGLPPSTSWQMAGDETLPTSQASGSTSHELRRSENLQYPWLPNPAGVRVESLPPADTSNWQTDGLDDDFGAPIRLGLNYGGPSGTGIRSDVTNLKRKRSPASSSPEEPLSQQSWHMDLEAEGEVAEQLLADDGSDVPLSQLSSTSSQVPEKSKKGKEKERAKTPDPSSVIVIPDTPPKSHKEILPPPSPQPEPLSSYTCPICFSQPTNATLTPCGHICCGSCLFAAVKTTIQRSALAHIGPALNEARCPVCRATIPGWDGKGGGVIGLKARAIFRL